MKCISLTQPWATLMAIGAKANETRDWRTGYRGPLAIASTKAKPDGKLVASEPFFSVLRGHDLPRGVVVAVVDLVDVVEASDAYAATLSPNERAFGGYGPKRFAFVTRAPKALRAPVAVRGELNIFDLHPDVARAVVEQVGTAESGAPPEAGQAALVDSGVSRAGPGVDRRDPHAFAGWSLADLEDFEERAAIIQYQGGRTREEAEREAYDLVSDERVLGRGLRDARREAIR